MNNVNVSLERANAIIASLVGQYVWFARCSEGRILRMEFGEPYLDIKNFSESSRPINKIADYVLSRRLVIPTGQWSLFVEDGLWQVDTGSLSCNRTDPDAQQFDLCLGRLNGQKLHSGIIDHSNSTLELIFDHGERVSTEFNTDFEENCQWILLLKDQWNLEYCANGSTEYDGHHWFSDVAK